VAAPSDWRAAQGSFHVIALPSASPGLIRRPGDRRASRPDNLNPPRLSCGCRINPPGHFGQSPIARHGVVHISRFCSAPVSAPPKAPSHVIGALDAAIHQVASRGIVIGRVGMDPSVRGIDVRGRPYHDRNSSSGLWPVANVGLCGHCTEEHQDDQNRCWHPTRPAHLSFLQK